MDLFSAQFSGLTCIYAAFNPETRLLRDSWPPVKRNQRGNVTKPSSVGITPTSSPCCETSAGSIPRASVRLWVIGESDTVRIEKGQGRWRKLQWHGKGVLIHFLSVSLTFYKVADIVEIARRPTTHVRNLFYPSYKICLLTAQRTLVEILTDGYELPGFTPSKRYTTSSERRKTLLWDHY